MRRVFSLALMAVFLLTATFAFAQSDGSVRGFVKDEQGAVLPGVTVTATSPALLAPVTWRSTDASGYYRLLNLPPGTYAITAELAGFSTFRREGVVMRAGLTLTVDIDLTIGSLAETITVVRRLADDRDQPADERDQHRRRAAAGGADHLAPAVQRRARHGARASDRATWTMASAGGRTTSAARTSTRTPSSSRARRPRPTSTRRRIRWAWAATPCRTSRSSSAAPTRPRRSAPAW